MMKEKKPEHVFGPDEVKPSPGTEERKPWSGAAWIRDYLPAGRMVPFGLQPRGPVGTGIAVFPYGDVIAIVDYITKKGEIFQKARKIEWTKNGRVCHQYIRDIVTFPANVAHQVADAIADMANERGETREAHAAGLEARKRARLEEKLAKEVEDIGV